MHLSFHNIQICHQAGEVQDLVLKLNNNLCKWKI